MDNIKPSSRDRYLRDVKKLQKFLLLNDDKFNIDFFANNDNLVSIETIIESQSFGIARKSEYIRSLCAVLSACYIPHENFKKILNKYSKTTPKPVVNDLNIYELSRFLDNDKLDGIIRLICLALINNISIDMSSILKSTINDELSEYNISIATKTWRIGKKTILLNDKFCECIIKYKITTIQNFSLSKVSRMFKNLTGYNYSDYSRVLNELGKNIIDIDSKYIDNKHEEIITNADSEHFGYEWDYLESLGINIVHIKNIQRLSVKIGISEKKFDINVYNDIKILDFIKNDDIMLNTKHNIITSLCVILDKTAGLLYNEYSICRMQMELDLARTNLTRIVPWFPNLYNKLYKIYKDITIRKSIRILCLSMVCNIKDSDGLMTYEIDDDEIGVLRPSDFMNTRLNCDNGDESYLNMAEKCWTIRGKYTKNKCERVLRLNSKFTNGIEEIYGNKLPQYLIVTESGTKYSSGFSDGILDSIGINFDIIRASYFTWRETTVTRRIELLNLCRKQGHQYSTAMLNYKRHIDYSIEL